VIIPENILKTVFVLNATFVLLLGISFLQIERGSGAFVVATLAMVANVLILVLIGVVVYVQRRFGEQKTVSE
jgi:hypothetical protein